MSDLHDWITQRVNEVETVAHATEQPSPNWEYDDFVHEARDLSNGGTVANVYRDGTGAHIALHDPAAVLRRCEADRRILNRHRLNPDAYWADAAMCAGCGTEGEMEYARTENLNDCPELLDLGYAHGLTDEILATLDRPQEGERPERTGPPLISEALAEALYGPMIRMAMRDVPAGLRGPNWKARP